MGSFPWSRRIPHAAEQLRLHATDTEPVLYSLGAATAEPMRPNCWAHEPQLQSPRAPAGEAHTPGACAPQWEEPWQWESYTLQIESSPHSPQLEKSLRSSTDPAQTEMDIIILKKKSFTVTPVSMEPVCKSNEICTGSVCWEVQNIDKIKDIFTKKNISLIHKFIYDML